MGLCAIAFLNSRHERVSEKTKEHPYEGALLTFRLFGDCYRLRLNEAMMKAIAPNAKDVGSGTGVGELNEEDKMM